MSSLYNNLFGKNPNTPALLSFIGLKEEAVPRFRDCYLEDDFIVVYTRTGGNNREAYDNTILKSNSFYASDEDDGFDNTFAHWKFHIPTQFREAVDKLRQSDEGNPRQKWDKMMAAMQKGDKDDPMFKRAMEIGKPLMEKIGKAFDDGNKTVAVLDSDIRK